MTISRFMRWTPWGWPANSSLHLIVVCDLEKLLLYACPKYMMIIMVLAHNLVSTLSQNNVSCFTTVRTSVITHYCNWLCSTFHFNHTKYQLLLMTCNILAAWCFHPSMSSSRLGFQHVFSFWETSWRSPYATFNTECTDPWCCRSRTQFFSSICCQLWCVLHSEILEDRREV